MAVAAVEVTDETATEVNRPYGRRALDYDMDHIPYPIDPSRCLCFDPRWIDYAVYRVALNRHSPQIQNSI